MVLIRLTNIKSIIYKKYGFLNSLIIFFIFMFYITILWNTGIAKSCYTILSLIAIYLIATRQINYNLSGIEKIFLWSIVAGFIWTVISYFVNGMPGKGGHWLIHIQLRILLIVPIYLMLRSRPIPPDFWWIIVGIGASVSGVIAISDIIWVNGWPGGRSHGDTNAIYFGQISLCLALFTLIGIKAYYSTGKIKKIFWVISVSLGLFAMMLSGSRSVWIAIPILIIITFWFLTINLTFYKKIIVFGFFLLIPIALFQFPASIDRYQKAEQNLIKYIDSENVLDPVRKSNVGLRLDAWRVMLITIKNNPIFGIGVGGFENEMQRYISDGVVHPNMTLLPHSHNQYIEATLNSGMLGFIFNLLIFIIPSVLFLNYYKKGNVQARPYIISGLILITAYLTFGMSDVTLARKLPIMFFGLTLPILISLTVHVGKRINRYPL